MYTEEVDRHPVLAWMALVGLALGGVLAVVGMPPVDLHGPTHQLGLMSPTCGMTRGVAAMVRGDITTAMAYNPASPLLVLGAVAAMLRLAIGRATRRWLTVHLHVTLSGWVVLAGALLILAARQQQNAELLLGP
jgi:hypothetical protein